MKKQETEHTEKQKQKLKEIAKDIVDKPLEWVLFLGSGISYRKDYCRHQIYQLARRLAAGKEVRDSVKRALYEAVQDQDDLRISEILFGNIWDNASFLEEQQEKQQERRRNYAEGMVKRDAVNVDCDQIHLKHLLEIFSGIILTTCQDETIEAFLEYQKSMPVDDLVCTPYIMNTSSRWDYWLRTGRGDVTRFLSEEEMQEHAYILVKLYGSSSMPHRMLLSKQDFEAYYSNRQTEHTKTMFFLKQLFETKNLLFLGVDFKKNNSLPLAEGILDLLKDTGKDIKGNHIAEESKIKRYAVGDDLNIKQFEQYQIDPICGTGMEALLNSLCAGLQKNVLMKKEELEENKELLGMEVLEQFGRYYIRRPFKGIFSKEKHEGSVDGLMKKELEILKKDILGIDDAGNVSKKWCHMSVWQLAAAANNLADFYDLKQIFEKAEKDEKEKNPQGNGTIAFYKNVTWNILTDRLSEKSLLLHRILLAYGKGFPWGFLPFLSKDENELKEWKRAGIRLANSGFYRKRQRRKTIQKRMSYADRVMLTAGEYPQQKRLQFKNQMEQICQQTGNSYFYPFENMPTDKNEEKNKSEDHDKKKENGNTQKNTEITRQFENMFKTMLEVLKDKREGYQQLHSLLQTETEAIFEFVLYKMGECDTKLEWKPALLHSLLLESRMMPVEYSKLEKEIRKFREITKEWDETTGLEKSRKKFEVELCLCQIEIIIWSHLLGNKGQGQEGEDAESKIMHKCGEVQAMLRQKKLEYTKHNAGSIPEWLFELQMQFMVLKSRIYNRRSSVAEIERCSKEQKAVPDAGQIWRSLKKQKAVLDKMHRHLHIFEKMISNREKICGNTYEMPRTQLNHLWGQYYFKMSQFYWENRKDTGNSKEYVDYKEEETYYQKAEKAYEGALQYYNKYPSQYGIQRADVMRDLADLNCQKYKGLEGVKMHHLHRNSEEERCQIQERCYDQLIEAYILYRNNSDLHGIADVLQSMGNAESFAGLREKNDNRSPFSFHEAAKDIYKYLKDEWSRYVVSEFVQGVLDDRRNESAEEWPVQ